MTSYRLFPTVLTCPESLVLWVKTSSLLCPAIAAIPPLVAQALARYYIFRRLETEYDCLMPEDSGEAHHDSCMLRHPYLQSKEKIPLYNLLVNDDMWRALQSIVEASEGGKTLSIRYAEPLRHIQQDLMKEDFSTLPEKLDELEKLEAAEASEEKKNARLAEVRSKVHRVLVRRAGVWR